MTPPGSCTGGSVVTDLVVTVGGVPVAIVIGTGPNQVFPLPGGIGSITINEQISAGPGDITVNALHVVLTPMGLASTDLVVASSHSDIQCAVGPTAAAASISGRVQNSLGRPISNARIQVLDQEGRTWHAVTSSFGFYTIEDIPVGGTYLIEVNHKRFVFSPRVISVNDSVTGLDFIAEGK
jgi:hypothetical protein